MGIERVIIKNFKKIKDTLIVRFSPGMNILVGDNEAGKTTILEALHLALTGQYQGRSIRNQISEYLFNREAVVEYLDSFNSGKPKEPPEILIEVYFSTDTVPEYEGNGNTESADGVEGMQFKLELSEDFLGVYSEMVENGPLSSLPIEGYIPTWQSFDRTKCYPKYIKYKTALIDSSSANYNHSSDRYISMIVNELLDKNDIKSISRAHRQIIDSYAKTQELAAINEKIQSSISPLDRRITVSPDRSSKCSWETILVANVNEIPFVHSGKGTQCIIQTKLSLNQKKSEKAGTILIEEPENHLSHSRLSGLVEMICHEKKDKQIIITTHSSFVANKLGLENLILLSNNKIATFEHLKSETYSFFRKLSGYDTLRFLLSRKSILVEGDSDELVVQRAYMDLHQGRLPIMDGIDVIKVGLTFERYLEIASMLDLDATIVTDNDGHPDRLEVKKNKYKSNSRIKFCYDPNISCGEMNGFNYNTLEPKMLEANSVDLFNNIFKTEYEDKDSLLKYMKREKTKCAFAIFDYEQNIKYPNYILEAVKDE